MREIAVEGRPVIEDGRPTRLIGTSRDVTAERDAERLKDEFIGLVSHELRTPLTSIIGYTELLAEVESGNLSEQGRRFVEVIDRNSRRELDLVADLLTLTKITRRELCDRAVARRPRRDRTSQLRGGRARRPRRPASS